MLSWIVADGGSACKISHHMLGITTFDRIKGTVDLGPGFLEEQEPDVVATDCLSEGWFALEHWDEVVDDHFGSSAIHGKVNSVDSTLTDGSVHKYTFEPIGLIRHSHQRREEVAVTKQALLQVFLVNLVWKDGLLAIEQGYL